MSTQKNGMQKKYSFTASWKPKYRLDTLTNVFEYGIIPLQKIMTRGWGNMSQKSLTVGDVMKIKDYLERIKNTANDEEKATIDELVEKLEQMEARS